MVGVQDQNLTGDGVARMRELRRQGGGRLRVSGNDFEKEIEAMGRKQPSRHCVVMATIGLGLCRIASADPPNSHNPPTGQEFSPAPYGPGCVPTYPSDQFGPGGMYAPGRAIPGAPQPMAPSGLPGAPPAAPPPTPPAPGMPGGGAPPAAAPEAAPPAAPAAAEAFQSALAAGAGAVTGGGGLFPNVIGDQSPFTVHAMQARIPLPPPTPPTPGQPPRAPSPLQTSNLRRRRSSSRSPITSRPVRSIVSFSPSTSSRISTRRPTGISSRR